MMLWVVLVTLGCLVGQSCNAILDFQSAPEPIRGSRNENRSSKEDFISLDLAAMSTDEAAIWQDLAQTQGRPKTPRFIYDSMIRLFDIRGLTPFRLGELDSDFLMNLIYLKGVLGIDECSERNIQNRRAIPIDLVVNNVNLLNYVTHYSMQFIEFCYKTLSQAVIKIVKNLGKKRQKRINDLREISYSGQELHWDARLSTNLANIVAKYGGNNLEKKYPPGTPEHMSLFESKVEELVGTTCHQLIKSFIPWIPIYTQLNWIRETYLIGRSFLDNYTKKWITNALVCNALAQVQNRAHRNFMPFYQKYVTSRMNKLGQLYPGEPAIVDLSDYPME